MYARNRAARCILERMRLRTSSMFIIVVLVLTMSICVHVFVCVLYLDAVLGPLTGNVALQLLFGFTV